jgi:hypothetical protein
MDEVRRIADAVLYEGYLLWPYRRSALKNQRRWTFGGVYPRDHAAERSDDPWTMRTTCLLEAGADDAVEVTVRFLQVVDRGVARVAADGALEQVDELTVAGRRHLTWQEAVEREIPSGPLTLGALEDGQRLPVLVPAGTDVEDLRDLDGGRAGALLRRRRRLEGTIAVGARRLAEGLFEVGVTIANTSPFAGGSREEALHQTFCSAHTVLHAPAGRFVSLTDPPASLRDAAAACVNEGAWPVLVGAPGDRRTVLSSPIILEDHPRVAPESPGDLFDGAEVDQLLRLSILALTEEEKAEMRDVDPRARAILERTEALTPAELMALHGTTARDFGPARPGGD